MVNDAHNDLMNALDLTEVGTDTFRGPLAQRALPRVFGGQVLAQALVAAGRTVEDCRAPNSLHAYFLSGGDPSRAITYRVTTLRDGRSLSSRQVVAYQGDHQIFTMLTSFASDGDGLTHQYDEPELTPPADALPTLEQRLAPERSRLPRWWTDEHPFDIRFVEHPIGLAAGAVGLPKQSMWIRSPGTTDAAPILHAALTAYASDLTLLDPALMPHGRSWYGERAIDGASIDHALWFHRTPRIDQWLLCEQVSPIARAGRCLCATKFFDSFGNLSVTGAQEGVLREQR